MSLEQNGARPDKRQALPPPASEAAPSDACPLSEAELQERYRKEYLEQLRKMSCPGCGEDPFFG